MPETTSDHHEDEREQYTRTETTNVELSYTGGTLTEITVSARYERGHRPTDESLNNEYIEEQTEADVTFSVNDDSAELWGFYPDTHRTGRKLHRETLRSLRVLNHAYEEVQTRVDDAIEVVEPSQTVVETIGNGILHE